MAISNHTSSTTHFIVSQTLLCNLMEGKKEAARARRKDLILKSFLCITVQEEERDPEKYLWNISQWVTHSFPAFFFPFNFLFTSLLGPIFQLFLPVACTVLDPKCEWIISVKVEWQIPSLCSCNYSHVEEHNTLSYLISILLLLHICVTVILDTCLGPVVRTVGH